MEINQEKSYVLRIGKDINIENIFNLEKDFKYIEYEDSLIFNLRRKTERLDIPYSLKKIKVEIKGVQEIKYLGHTIDNKCTGAPHVNCLIKTLNSFKWIHRA